VAVSTRLSYYNGQNYPEIRLLDWNRVSVSSEQ